MTARIRVGTRRSPLARRQTDLVITQLRNAAQHVRFEPVPITTSGDEDQRVGGSPDFTDAIDRALLRGEIDLAVHSAKDLPVELGAPFRLAACPRRANPRDCLVTGPGVRAARLPFGARVGSSSLRRRAQLLNWRPDLEIIEIRGNVDTRIGLVRSGQIEAAILAVAGVARLGRSSEIARVLPTSTFLPAPAQGALAIVTRSNETELAATAGCIDHPGTHAAVIAERAFAAALGGDCTVPLGALATVRGNLLSLQGEVLSPDGRTRLRSRRRGAVSRAESVGTELGKELLDRGARDLWPHSGR